MPTSIGNRNASRKGALGRECLRWVATFQKSPRMSGRLPKAVVRRGSHSFGTAAGCRRLDASAIDAPGQRLRAVVAQSARVNNPYQNDGPTNRQAIAPARQHEIAGLQPGVKAYEEQQRPKYNNEIDRYSEQHARACRIAGPLLARGRKPEQLCQALAVIRLHREQ